MEFGFEEAATPTFNGFELASGTMKADVSALLFGRRLLMEKQGFGTWKRRVGNRHTTLSKSSTPMGVLMMWLGALPVSNRSQYAVVYAVIVSVQRFDGNNIVLISAAGAEYAEVEVEWCVV